MLSMSATTQATAVMLAFFYLFVAGLAVMLACRGRRARLLAGGLCLTAAGAAAAYTVRYYDWLWAVEPGGPAIFVLDHRGSGISLTASRGFSVGNAEDYSERRVYVDLDGDGFRERVGWVRPNAAILLVDGKVLTAQDDFNGRPVGGLARLVSRLALFWRDGMAPLRALDDNGDGIVSLLDDGYERLELWRDRNLDGMIDDEERISAEELDLMLTLPSIWLEHDVRGNRVQALGFATRNGLARTLARVVPARDAVFAIPPPLPAGLDRTLVEGLPDLGGYGRVRRLHDVMLLDEELRRGVAAFAALGPGDFRSWRASTQTLFYRWSGVAERPEDSRRRDTLVAIYNDDWRPFHPDRGSPVAESVESAWRSVFRRMHANLVMQGPMREVFPGLAYDICEHAMLLEGKPPPMAALVAGTAALEPPGDRAAYWCEMVAVLDVVQLDAKDEGYDPALQAALAPLGLTPQTVRQAPCLSDVPILIHERN